MVDLEKELLDRAGQLRKASTLARLREVRADIEGLVPRVESLDSEQPAQDALRRFYAYLDAVSAAAVRDGAAVLRTEHAEIERRLLTVIDQFRRSDSATIAIPLVAMHELYEQIAGLERGSSEQWMLARLYEYAAWQRREAEQRDYKRIARSVASLRTRTGPGYSTATPPTGHRRSRGREVSNARPCLTNPTGRRILSAERGWAPARLLRDTHGSQIDRNQGVRGYTP